MKTLLLGSGGLSTEERLQAWRTQCDLTLGAVKEVYFLPYAGNDYAAYLKRVIELKLVPNRKVIGLHEVANPKAALESSEAIFVGGGNSFRLLNQLYQLDLLATIRKRVEAGIPYLGISAGTNMACPTLKTTNDMPIVQPPSFEALGLIPFQINPHYFAGPLYYELPQGVTKYGGETRDDRLREFHEMNSIPVMGLYEGSILKIQDGKARLEGIGGARMFQKGLPPKDLPTGTDVSIFLQ